MSIINLNRLKKCIYIIIIFGLLIPGISNAQTTTDKLDFGEVAIDKAKSIYLDLQNNNDVSITIFCRVMRGDLGFTTLTVPVTLNPGDKYELEVTFTPFKEGPSSDELRIYYFASTATRTALLPQTITVTGIGIVAEDPTIEGLLEFFNDSVKNGDLIGLGKGKSASNRLDVFGEMLKKAETAITAGKIDEGLAHLKMADKKINVFVGEGKDGDAITTLKDMIKYLLENPS